MPGRRTVQSSNDEADPAPRAPRPERVVRRELLRALGGVAAAPFRFVAFLPRQRALLERVRAELAYSAEPVEPAPCALPARPLRVFVSCAEPSGEEHALRLVRRLRERAAAWGGPAPELVGLGGARLAAEGVRIVGDPVRRAAMGSDVLRSLAFYRALLVDAAREISDRRPDVVVPVDSPALHVPLGRIARRYGVPVVHYITPQYWGWAPWRVHGYRRAVDLALSILPFEAPWFRRHGVPTIEVGHPQSDVLADVPAPDDRARRTLCLLPGSRTGVIARNLPFLLRVVARMRREVPDLEAVIPHERPELAPEIEALVRADPSGAGVLIRAGDLHAELARARIALSVSGTVLLDLLHHRLPMVAVYQAKNRYLHRLQRRLLTVPWFASVNLLAGEEVVPEFTYHGQGPVEEVAAHLLRWYKDAQERARTRGVLEAAARRLGPAGAAGRAAGHVLRTAVLGKPAPTP